MNERPSAWILRHVAWAAILAASLSTVTQEAVAQEKAAPPKSSPEAARIYQDAASFQNNGAFDLAVEEWQKLLKNHPQDPLAAKAQHYLGVCLLQTKQLEQAAAAFQAVIKNHPKFELLEETWLNLASTQYSLAAAGKPELYASAADSFGTLIKQYPKGKFLEEALYFQGEAYYAQGKRAEAEPVYQRLVNEFPTSKRRADALYALGVTQEELSKFAEAGATYDLYLKEFESTPLATEVKMRKGETILHAGDYPAAAKIFGEVAAVQDFASADHAIFRQAYAVAKQDKFAEAGALYAKVVIDYPKSAYVNDAVMAAGRSLYKAEQFDVAATWLKRAIDAKSEAAPEAAHWLCRILIRQKKPAEAAQLAAAQIAAGGDSTYVVHLKLDQADALYEIPERRAEAMGLFAKLAADHPQHEVAPQALYNAAFAALEVKNHAEALKHAQAFLKAYPKDELLADVRYVEAESQLQLKNYDAAAKAYSELVAAHAGHQDADAWRVRVGLVAYVQKKYAEAIAALTPIVDGLKSPDANAEAQFIIGASHFFSDRFAEAAAAFTASLAANPKWKQADETLLLLARSQAKQGQNEEAVANAQRVISEYPNSDVLDQAHYQLGEFAFAANDFTSAIAWYQTVVTKWPESPFAPYALYRRAWSELKSKDASAAAEGFTALLTKYPDHTLKADALLGRAMSRRQAGDAKGALDDIDAYLATNPDAARRSDALYERGLTQVAAQDFAGAVKTLDDLLQEDPKYASADKVLYELGWSLKSQNKHAEAVPHFAKLAAEHAESPLAAEASFHVGEDHYEKKQYAEAAKAYTAVQAKAPAGELAEKATYKLNWSLFQQKMYDEALRGFRAQLAWYAKGPLAADATFMTAECFFRLEKYDEAFSWYRIVALDKKPSTEAMQVLTLLHGGQSAAQLKQWDDAVSMLSQIPEKHPDTPLLAEAHYELGWARQNLGKADEALKDYEVAATKSREHVGARARFMMGEIYFEQKKHTEAQREFQRAMFGFGGEQATPETKNWQAKSGYEAGRCAEVQIMAAKDAAARQKPIADAKRFYSFVTDKHPQHELAAEAKKRLEALAKL